MVAKCTLLYTLIYATAVTSSALADDAIVATGPEGFNAVVKPFLTKHCYECHGDDEPEGDLDLIALSLDIKTAVQADGWLKALDQLQAGLMPPLDEKRPNSAERARVIYWIENAVLKSGHAEAYRRKMLMPAFGNYVDHDLLFGGKIKAKAFTPARLWRNNPYIFKGVGGVGSGARIQNPYTFSTPANGFRDYASTSDVGSSVVETLLLNANSEFEIQIAAARLQAEKPPARNSSPLIVFVKPGAEIKDAHMAAPIRSTFQRQVRRAPTEEEAAKYLDFLKKNLAETSDPVRSLRVTLTAIYLSPEAIYRMEWGLGKTDEHGRRRLSPGEVWDALSYALFDDNRSFTKALGEGKLSTREDVSRVIDERLSTPAHELSVVPGVMRFIHEFFGYHRAREVFKDGRRVNEHGLWHNPGQLGGEADSLIKIILGEDKNVFERMLTTSEALVSHTGNNQQYVDQYKAQIAGLKLMDQARVDKEIAVHIRNAMTHRKFTGNPPRQKARLAELERLRKTNLARRKAELAHMLTERAGLEVARRAAVQTARRSAGGYPHTSGLACGALGERWQSPDPPRDLGLRKTAGRCDL